MWRLLLDQQDGTNWCNPASDDNLQVDEMLEFVFDSAKKSLLLVLMALTSMQMVSGLVFGLIPEAGIIFRLLQIR